MTVLRFCLHVSALLLPTARCNVPEQRDQPSVARRCLLCSEITGRASLLWLFMEVQGCSGKPQSFLKNNFSQKMELIFGELSSNLRAFSASVNY